MMMKRFFRIVLTAALTLMVCLLSLPASAQAAGTAYVSTYQQLKDALLGSGDIVITDDIRVEAALSITRTVTITGEMSGASGQTLRRASGYYGTLFDVGSQGALTVTNVILDGENKAGVTAALVTVNNGSLTLNGLTALRQNINTADGGGGVSAYNTALSIKGNVRILNNESALGGGIYASGGVTTIGGSAQISDNKARDGGGGVYVSGGTLTINGQTELADNTAASAGGGICFDNGMQYIIEGSTKIDGNTATNGGGIYARNSTLTIRGNAAVTGRSGDSALRGGGLYTVGSSHAIITESASITGNAANRDGGGIYVAGGSLTLSGSAMVTQNKTTNGEFGSKGGGILIADGAGDTVICDNAIVSYNASVGDGGGLGCRGGKVTIKDSASIVGNTAKDDGGGIHISYGYMATGVILNEEHLVIEGNAQVVSNTAGRNGGGIYGGSRNVTLRDNAKVARNTATGKDSLGGGVYVHDSALRMSGYSEVALNDTGGSYIGGYIGAGGSGVSAGAYADAGTMMLSGHSSIHSNEKDGVGIKSHFPMFMKENATITNNNGLGIMAFDGTQAVFQDAVSVHGNSKSTYDIVTDPQSDGKLIMSGRLTGGANINVTLKYRSLLDASGMYLRKLFDNTSGYEYSNGYRITANDAAHLTCMWASSTEIEQVDQNVNWVVWQDKAENHNVEILLPDGTENGWKFVEGDDDYWWSSLHNAFKDYVNGSARDKSETKFKIFLRVIHGDDGSDTSKYVDKTFDIPSGLDITLSGAPLQQTKIDSDQPFIRVHSGATLRLAGIVLQGNGISTNQKPLIEVMEGGTLILESGAVIKDCVSQNGGAAISNNGTLIIESNAMITNCVSGGNGGAIFSDNVKARTSINGGIFRNNKASNGGAIYAVIYNDDSFRMENAKIYDNEATNDGGGLYIRNHDWSIINSSVMNNKAGKNGGGVYKGSSTDANLALGGQVKLRDNVNGNLFLPSDTLTIFRVSSHLADASISLTTAPKQYPALIAMAQNDLVLSDSDAAAVTHDGYPEHNVTVFGALDNFLVLRAPGKLPAPKGLAWGSNAGEASWTAVENASSYSVQLYKNGSAEGFAAVSTTQTSVSFSSLINESGNYTFRVTAIGDAISYSDSDPSAASAVYAYAKPTVKLDAPANPMWVAITVQNQVKAKWNAVANASSYSVQLYMDGSLYGNALPASACELDVSLSESGHYTFRVTAIGDALVYSNSDPSVESAAYTYLNPAIDYTISFTTQPQDITVTEGSITGSLTAEATVTPSGTLNMGWLRCSSTGQIEAFTDDADSTFEIPTNLTAGTYYYVCYAWNGSAQALSSIAKVTVESFIPVTDITFNGTLNAVVDTDLTLSAAAAPANATYRTILWSLNKASATGAALSNGVFRATATGTATVTATIENGKAAGVPFTKNFTINVVSTPVAAYPVTLNITRDNIAYGGLAVVIRDAGGSGYTLTEGVSGVYANSAVPNGTYTVSIGGASTGESIIVNDASCSAALDFFTVSFESNGGAPAPANQTVIRNGYAAAPLAMAKETDTFGGWYSDSALASPWTFSESKVTSTTTLHAKWIPAPPQIVATPIISLSSDTYVSAQSVTISCATAGATIRYTTDGSEPTQASEPYVSAINVSTSMTLQAKAFKTGMTDSATASAAYTILSAPFDVPISVSPTNSFPQGSAPQIEILIGEGLAGFNIAANYAGIASASQLQPGLGDAGTPGPDGKLEDGSIKITLYPSYLNTLAQGSYTLRVRLGGGGYPPYIETRLIVTAPVSAAPNISAQPASQSVTEGQTATFSVTATGTPALSYQWQISMDNGASWNRVSDGTGGTSARYTTPATTTAMRGYQYRCVVSNGVSSDATSSAATLTVNAVLRIPAEPTDQYVVVGQQATISVTATGDGLTYQWYINRNNGRGWRKIDHATGPRHVTTPVDLDCDGYRYYCHIEDEHENKLDSRIATLHVQEAPALPQTGDSATPGRWLAMLLLGGIALFMLIWKRRKA